MKTKKNYLEVDSIGGQGSLTAKEAIALSDFFKNRNKNTKKVNLKNSQQSPTAKNKSV